MWKDPCSQHLCQGRARAGCHGGEAQSNSKTGGFPLACLQTYKRDAKFGCSLKLAGPRKAADILLLPQRQINMGFRFPVSGFRVKGSDILTMGIAHQPFPTKIRFWPPESCHRQILFSPFTLLCEPLDLQSPSHGDPTKKGTPKRALQQNPDYTLTSLIRCY